MRLGHKKLFKDKKSGLMHLVLFYAFFIIQIGLIELIIKGFIKGYEFPLGEAHKYFSLLQEWATFLMLLAVVYGFYRRYGEKLKRLQWKRDGKAAFVIYRFITLTLSILVSLGFETIMLGHEPNLVYAPFSGMIASIVFWYRNNGRNGIVLRILVGSYANRIFLSGICSTIKAIS